MSHPKALHVLQVKHFACAYYALTPRNASIMETFLLEPTIPLPDVIHRKKVWAV